MSEDFSAWNKQRRLAHRLAIGEKVRLKSGVLAGLTGIIAGFTASNNCVLTIDGLPGGVRVVVGCDAIQWIPEKAGIGRD